MARLIAMLSDFGHADAYVGVMKGVMLGINSRLRFIDLSHSIEPFNILSAAYILYTAWDYFPDETTFLSVVDPGVGSSRGILLSRIDNKYLVSPDNGTVSLLHRMKRDNDYYAITGLALEKVMVSDNTTFHGRGIFSPLAANIATYGLDFITAKRGTSPVLLEDVEPWVNGERGVIRGRIIHIDNFGNCVTNINFADLEGDLPPEEWELHIAGHNIRGISSYFSQVEVGKPLFYLGSSGFIEIGVREGSARLDLKIRNSMEFTLKNFKK